VAEGRIGPQRYQYHSKAGKRREPDHISSPAMLTAAIGVLSPVREIVTQASCDKYTAEIQQASANVAAKGFGQSWAIS
jgi:hypothetical protein